MDSQELREELRSKGIEYDEYFHKAVYTSEEGHMLSLPHSQVEAKNLFLKSKKGFVLITVKSNKRVDLKAMAKALGFSSFSFAKEEELRSILSLSPGAVTPMGLLNDVERRVKFYLDSDFKYGKIYVHPMENTSSMLLSSSDLFRFFSMYGIECNWSDIKTKEE